MMRRNSDTGLQKSDSSSTSENDAGEKLGGRLGRSDVSCTIVSAIFSMMLRFEGGRMISGMPTRSPPGTSTSASANETTSARSSLLHSDNFEVKSIDGERSGQSQMVCEASHSRS